MSNNFKKFCEQMGGGLPLNTNNPQQYGPMAKDIGPANINIVGNTLQIDTKNYNVALNLTPQQFQQLRREFKF